MILNLSGEIIRQLEAHSSDLYEVGKLTKEGCKTLIKKNRYDSKVQRFIS